MSDHFDDPRVSLHLLEGVGYDQQEDIEVSRSFDDVDEGVEPNGVCVVNMVICLLTVSLNGILLFLITLMLLLLLFGLNCTALMLSMLLVDIEMGDVHDLFSWLQLNKEASVSSKFLLLNCNFC